MEDYQIIFTIKKFKTKHPIARQIGNYLVLAQDEPNFRSKARKINIGGDRDVFMTLDQAYQIALKMD